MSCYMALNYNVIGRWFLPTFILMVVLKQIFYLLSHTACPIPSSSLQS